MNRPRLRIVVAAALLLALVGAAGCSGSKKAELDPPAQAVQSLLELRAERSTDASAYAEFVSTVELAEELARAAREETSTAPPTPQWETPYVATESTSTADVVVVWKDRTDHPEFPAATIFVMEPRDEQWVAADARTVEETASIPPPAD